MRIAVVARPWYPVPPSGYGGIEWVVALLPRLMTALATAHVRQGNTDEACRIGGDAGARRRPAAITSPGRASATARVQPWHDAQVVREFDDQLAAVGHN
jgi:hypothetical protein